jgi:hypothetical protein
MSKISLTAACFEEKNHLESRISRRRKRKKDLKAKIYLTFSTLRLKFFQNLTFFQNIKVNADALALLYSALKIYKKTPIFTGGVFMG